MASTQSGQPEKMEVTRESLGLDSDDDFQADETPVVPETPSNNTHRSFFLKEDQGGGVKNPLVEESKRKKRKSLLTPKGPKPDPLPIPNPIPLTPPSPIPPTPPNPNPPLPVPSDKGPVQGRARQYTMGSQKEWVVFFRPKQKPLNFVRITKDLQKYYFGVVQCTKMNKSKLRVIVNSAEQANQIVTDMRFCVEYRVWIPARIVEIDGVVTDDGLSLFDLTNAVGRFKNPKLAPVQILESRQLGNVTNEGDKKKFVPSSSFRVTFAGSALPDYIELYKLRLPVRLYVPRVMSCTNCQQLGHTKTYCSNKSKCSKCAGPHKDVECQKQAEKCQLCGKEPHKTRQCPKYKEREDKMKQSLKERSKKSFAEILRQVNDSNPFAPLVEEEEDDDTEVEEEVLFVREEDSDTSSGSTGPKPKRKKVVAAGIGGKKGGSYEEDFPFGPSGNKDPPPKPVPNPPKPNPIPAKPTPIPPKPDPKPLKPPKPIKPDPMEGLKGLVSFSTIVEWLCNLVSEPIRLLIKQFEPIVRNIGKQLVSTMPLLSIISFDG